MTFDFQLPPVLPSGIRDEEILVAAMNMGGPKDIASVEPFLRRLFNDPLIIRFPFAQSLFADWLIRKRLKDVEHRYGLIGGGSPILKSSLQQVDALAHEFKKRGRNLDVQLSFNYSDPLPEEVIGIAKEKGKKYILPLSLYPHFSNSTTASNIFYLKETAQKNYPELQFLSCLPYHLYDGYIQAFADRIHAAVGPGEYLDDFFLLFSAHGTPQYFINEGDPYAFLVSQSVSRITQKLNRHHQWTVSYQSEVGPLKWLRPSTLETLEALGKEGIRRIIVVPISFVTDHIETLCEIDMEYREDAEKKFGFTDYRMSKAIESHPAFISALADCVEASLTKGL